MNQSVSAPSLLHPHIPFWVAVLIACVSSFMVVMDGAIVNVALPSMQTDLHMSRSQVQWVVDAYLLCLGGFMLLAARASDLYGRKLILQSGLTIFTLASLVGGLASDPTMLLVARAIQGVGASALATSTLSVIVAVCPSNSAKMSAISAWAASSSIASAMGVVIGGALTSLLNWRWVMFVNVPIGLLLMFGVGFCLQSPSKRKTGAKLDLGGAISVTLGMGMFIFEIMQAVDLGWRSTTVRIAFCASAVLISSFVWIQATAAQPLIPLSIFKLHSVRMGNVVVLCLGASLTASSFFLSIVLQQLAAYNALDTGLALLPMGLSLALAAIVSRPLMDRGWRRLPFLGGIVSALGLIWISVLPVNPVYLTDVLGPTLLIGLGLGLMLMSAAHTALAGVPSKEAGVASGLFNTSRQLGAALGIAALSTLAHEVIANVPGNTSAVVQLQAYHAAFLGAAVLSVIAAFTSLALSPLPHKPSTH